MKELITVIIAGIGLALITAMFGVIAVLILTPFTYVSCNAMYPDIEHKYLVIGGCMVKTDEGWIPAKQYYKEGKD